MTENGQEFEPIVIKGMERTRHLRIQWRRASIATEELWDSEDEISLFLWFAQFKVKYIRSYRKRMEIKESVYASTGSILAL